MGRKGKKIPNFEVIAENVLKKGYFNTEERRAFRSEFGVSTKVFSSILKVVKFGKTTQPYHVLWALNFLKTYGSESSRARSAGVTRKTLRKHTWKVIKRLAKHMPKVVSQNFPPGFQYLIRVYNF
jgi:hypothetical protein